MTAPVKSICMDFPILNGTYMVQLVLPRALCKQDAERLIGLIKCWPQVEDDKLPMGCSEAVNAAQGEKCG